MWRFHTIYGHISQESISELTQEFLTIIRPVSQIIVDQVSFAEFSILRRIVRCHDISPALETLKSNNAVNSQYRQTSNISSTKSHHLNVSRLVLQLSMPNPLKPDVKSRMKM